MRTIDLDYGDESRTRRIRWAACAAGMSGAEFIRACVDIGIEKLAQRDHWLAMLMAEEGRKVRR